jgi:hypothetical protein
MTERQPVVHDNPLDPDSVGHVTAIPASMHGDLKECLQQALEYLELAEHAGDQVILQTIDIEHVLELAEAVFEYCCSQLEKYKQ